MEEEVQAILALRDNERKLKKAVKSLISELFELRSKVERLEAEAGASDQPLFTIDNDPVEEEDMESEAKIVYHEPQTLKVLSAKDKEPGEEDEKKKEEKSFKNSCFNCNGDHTMTDCPQPKNYQMITKNRKEFMRNMPASSARYHLDEPQKFGHIKPGLPSENLRKALGLRDDQLPPYIYQMRTLGYPPGWLKEAEIQHSGMSLYLDMAKNLGDIGDEEGEVNDAEDKIMYDTSKVQEWPGFNVAIPENIVDETYLYRCPEMRPDQCKTKMLEELQPMSQKSYVRGEMQDTRTEREEVLAVPGEEEEKEPVLSMSVDRTPASLKVLSVNEGTPIVSTYSPYGSLPDQDKWAKDTTDHILFENLPESTGKWDKMLEVIKRGRKMMDDNKEDEQ